MSPKSDQLQNEISKLGDEILLEVANLKLKEQKIHSIKLLRLVNFMLGKLLVHLAIEDRVIYPKALTIANSKLSMKADELKRETGHLKDTAVAYRETLMQAKGKVNLSFSWQTRHLIELFNKRTKKKKNYIL